MVNDSRSLSLIRHILHGCQRVFLLERYVADFSPALGTSRQLLQPASSLAVTSPTVAPWDLRPGVAGSLERSVCCPGAAFPVGRTCPCLSLTAGLSARALASTRSHAWLQNAEPAVCFLGDQILSALRIFGGLHSCSSLSSPPVTLRKAAAVQRLSPAGPNFGLRSAQCHRLSGDEPSHTHGNCLGSASGFNFTKGTGRITRILKLPLV